ncbi:MAG: hypothetical protein ACRDE5_00710 [Ginsengibacter sp.]
MKLVSRVSLTFKMYKPVDKVTFGNGVINCLSPVLPPTLTTLPIPVADLQAVNDALNTAVINLQTSGSRQARTVVKNAVTEWITAFGMTAAYISMIAQGDDEIITAAGFDPTKGNSQPKPKPGLAADFQASINGFKGAILAGSQSPVPEATVYVCYALPAGVSVNFSENTMILTVEGKSVYINVATQKKTEMYNLPSTATFSVGMYAVNSAGAGPATALQQVTTQ